MKIKSLLIYLVSSLLLSTNLFSSEKVKYKLVLKKYGVEDEEEISLIDGITKEDLTSEIFMEELLEKVELEIPKELDMTRAAVVFGN